MDADTRTLLSGLDIPKGAHLTKVRLETLRLIGVELLKRHEIFTYKGTVQARGMHGLYLHGRHAAAFRAMGRAGWLRLGDPTDTFGWRKRLLVVEAPWDAVAKRLAGQEALWEERRAALQPDDGAREKLSAEWEEAQDAWRAMTPHPYSLEFDRPVSTKELLETWDRVKQAAARYKAETERLEEAHEAAAAAAEALPKPTAEEAITWLVMRELTTPRDS